MLYVVEDRCLKQVPETVEPDDNLIKSVILKSLQISQTCAHIFKISLLMCTKRNHFDCIKYMCTYEFASTHTATTKQSTAQEKLIHFLFMKNTFKRSY